MAYDDIKGYVGYWKGGKLIGIIVAEELLEVIGDYIDSDDDDFLHFSDIKDTDKNDSNESNHYIDLEQFEILKKYPQYKNYLYTGDYDLHEVYDTNGQLIPEGDKKAEMLNNLNGLSNEIKANNGILQNVPIKAYFQHGDQATYRDSLHNEAKKKGEDIVTLVPVVAVEETGRLAWFDKGNRWFISDGTEDHKNVRDEIGELKPPKEWEEDGPGQTSKRKQITRPYIKPYPDYKYGRKDEVFPFEFEFSSSFQVSSSILDIIKEKHRAYFDSKSMEIAKAKAINIIISADKNDKHIKEKNRLGYIYFINRPKGYIVTIKDEKIISFEKS